MLRCTFLLVIPLFIFTGCGDLEQEMQDTRTVILNMDFHKRSSSRSSPSVSATELSQYNTHLILALPSLEDLSSNYKNFYSSFAQGLMNTADKKVSLEIPLNTQMKIFAFLFKENYSMSELLSGVREVGYYGESRSFSINTNTNSLSLGITLKAASGNEDDSTGTGAGTGDTTAPTASVTTATITNSSNAVVQSTETGTAYLVKTTVSVSNLASITGAADNQWNSVAISSASTNTNLAATGLADGIYKVYAVDAAGNLSSASSNSVTLDTTAPTLVDNVTITSSTARVELASGKEWNRYKIPDDGSICNLNCYIYVTATFNESVIVDNSSGNPKLTIVVKNTNRDAYYDDNRSGNNELVFRYAIRSDDDGDASGISIGANALALNSGTIKDAAGNDATITHSAVADNALYKVKEL